MSIISTVLDVIQSNLMQTADNAVFMLTSPQAWEQFMSLFGLSQFLIALLGFTAISLATSKDEKKRRLACLFGLAGQPFWIYATIHTSSIGMFLISIGYTAVWGRGVWAAYGSKWFKKKK